MSTSITSAQIMSTTTTSYSWTGTANASPSVERINGFETRRNLVSNPSFAVDVTGWTAAATTTLSTESARAKLVAKGGGRNFFSTPLTVTAGTTYTAAADVMLPAATATSYRLVVEFYSDLTSYTYVGETASAQSFQSATQVTRVSHTFAVPSNVTGVVVYPLISTGTAPVNETVFVDSVLFEARGSASPFFDGSSPGSTVNTTATSQPLVVDGYESSRQSRNIFNDVIGRSLPDVNLNPASPRTGTLTMVFATEADALACEQMHSDVYPLTFSDSDLPSAAMTYVSDGSITRRLDRETRVLWLVTVDFREVA